MFARIPRAVRLERIGRGRSGALAVRCRADGAVPLMRSTTSFFDAPVPLTEDNVILMQIPLPAAVNHATVELYESDYRKMAFHSDHAQDLADDSIISIYSWYKDPTRADRQLVVRHKAAPRHEPSFVIPLEHNSVVQFTAATNREWLHKIVLATKKKSASSNEWLGVTARTSKTFVRFDPSPRFVDNGRLLQLVSTDAERREVFRMRREENCSSSGYASAELLYTLSASDLKLPVALDPLDPNKLTLQFVFLDASERERFTNQQQEEAL